MRAGQSAITIQEENLRGEQVRCLMVDGAIQSAVFLKKEKKYELVSPYLDQLSYAFSFRPDISRTLLIGGGGFAYPCYYISHYPKCSIDVVEINPEMIRTARTELYLGDLFKDFAIDPEKALSGDEGERLRIYTEDGIGYLLGCGIQYDFIAEDAYNGNHADAGLRSEDGIRLVKAHLKKNGIYAVNSVSALKGPLARRGRELEKTLRRHFRYVAVMPCDDTGSPWLLQNSLIFASDEEL